MDRQAWIAITLSIVGLFAWQMYVTKKYPVRPAPAAAHAAATPGGAAPAASNPPLVTSGQPDVVADRKEAAPAAAAADDTAPEQTETLKSDQLVLNFTSRGGGISAAVPQGKQHIAENGVNIQLGHAGNIPIGALSEQPGEGANLPYTLTKQSDRSLVAERTEPSGLKITKEYTFDWQGDPKQIPAVHLKISLTNTGAQPYKDDKYYVYAGSAAPIHRKDLPTYTAFDWMAGNDYHTDHVTSFDAGHIPLTSYETHPARGVITVPLTKVQWVAAKNQFYTTILTPLDQPGPDQEPAAREVWARRIDLPLTPEETTVNAATLHGVDVALGLPGLDLKPGETVTRNFQIYAGPKYYSRLERLGHNEQEAMDYGKFKVVSITLLALLNTFSKWLGNYALAIILLTIVVKALLFPLQNKANKSMRRMSALTPHMTALREKYKDDPSRLNKETICVVQRVRGQPGERLLADAHPDADLLRLPVHALPGGGTAQRELPVGKRPFPARHGGAPRGLSRQRAAAADDRHAVLADVAHPEDRRRAAAEDDDVHAAALRLFLLQLRRRAGPLLHDAGSVDDPPALHHPQPEPAGRWRRDRPQARQARRGQGERAGLRGPQGRAAQEGQLMNPTPQELLDTTLGHLGYAFEIQEDVAADGTVTLQVYTGEAERLIGPGGEALDDLQFLINRMLQSRDRHAPRVVVDVEHYRSMAQDGFLREIRQLADQVRRTGQPVQLEPMNSYDRRLVHNAFKDDPQVMTVSPPDDARLKRITLARRKS